MSSALEIREAITSGKRSVKQVIEESCERCEKLQQSTNAFSRILHTEALERANSLDKALLNGDPAGPLFGVPIAIKDNIIQTGIPATCGSRLLESYIGSYTATAVERLEQAGAVIVARTNMDEFGMGSSTESCAWGPVRNPWDLSRVPGGSSGGSAVAVAAGAVPLALGSDTGGSVRQPASFTGVVGLKPTYGRISRNGLVAFASSTDQIGPMAQTTADVALALEVMAGHDPKDSTSLKGGPPHWEPKSIQGLRIGRPIEYFEKGLAPEVRTVIETNLETLVKNGAEIIDISLPSTELALACYYIIAPAEASANLARFDGIRYGNRRTGINLEDTLKATRSQGFGAEVKRRILIGNYVLSAGYYDAYYGSAQRIRQHLKLEFKQSFEEVDAIISPTAPSLAFPLNSHTDPLQMYLGDAYTIPASLAGIPAISVPCGTAHDLPVGLQIMAKAGDEGICFNLAEAIENSRAPLIKPPYFVK